MFVTLLLITFIIAAATSTVIVLLFSKPVKKILFALIAYVVVRGLELKRMANTLEKGKSAVSN
jgi:hypothetical protein